MSEIAISVNNISKMYKLYENPMDRLKESLGLTRKKRYKEHYALNNVSFQVKKGDIWSQAVSSGLVRDMKFGYDEDRWVSREAMLIIPCS